MWTVETKRARYFPFIDIWTCGLHPEEIFSPTARKFLSIACNMRDLLSVVRILLPGKPGNVLHHEYLRSKCAGVIV